MILKKKTIVALLLVPQFFLVKLLSRFPEFVEAYYSRGIYMYVSKFLRWTLGGLPLSFGDLMYGFVLVFVFWWLVRHRKRFVSDSKAWFIDVFAFVSIIYFAFHLCWGLNYYRVPLYKTLNLKASYTTEQLVEVSERLIQKANAIHVQIATHDSLMIEVSYTKLDLLKRAPEGYLALGDVFSNLEYEPVSVKKSMFSLPLTYMGFSGYLNPWFNEAQVNSCIPVYKFATTTTHEIAHQLGFAAENEANFIGFLAAINNSDIYFKYCGYTFGLKYCLNEIYRRDKARYHAVVKELHPGVLKNYEEVRLFWQSHQNPTEPFFKSFYSGFLKANKQSKGIASYSYVVALLVNYIDKHGVI